MPGRPKLTWDTVYQGRCGKGHRFTRENTNAYEYRGKIQRACRTCVRRRREEKPQPGTVEQPKAHNVTDPAVLAFWQRTAVGGRAALVTEVSDRLNSLAGPYAVGVMPDVVFWKQFRAAFADRELPFKEGRI